jgi:hypothetical protein
MLRVRPHLSHIALAVGLALAAGVGIWLAVHPPATRTVTVVTTVAVSAPPPPPTTAPAPTTTAPSATTTAPAPPPAPTPVAFSWDKAGGLVYHPDSIDPAQLGREMRGAGFGWVAVFLGDGPDVSSPDASWVERFRAASGLAVGGWSVLRDDPVGEARAASAAITAGGLSFYIADAEAEYAYTNDGAQDPSRYARSRQFVQTFRSLLPTLPAGVSSYCRPDEHDLDWAAWIHGAFVFLPQAYVNDFGQAASPAACVIGAAGRFARADVHPTVGSYQGVLGFVAPAEYVHELAAAKTVGFSIFPAEVGMSADDWQVYGQAIATLGIAASS